MKLTLIKITSSWLCATGVAVISSYCILTHNNGKAGDQKKAEQTITVQGNTHDGRTSGRLTYGGSVIAEVRYSHVK